VDVSIEYIKLPPKGFMGEEEAIIIEHELETFVEVPPPEVDNGASTPTNLLNLY